MAKSESSVSEHLRFKDMHLKQATEDSERKHLVFCCLQKVQALDTLVCGLRRFFCTSPFFRSDMFAVEATIGAGTYGSHCLASLLFFEHFTVETTIMMS